MKTADRRSGRGNESRCIESNDNKVSSGEESDNGTVFGKQYRVIIRRTEDETGLEKNSRVVVVKNDAKRREEDTGERMKRRKKRRE